MGKYVFLTAFLSYHFLRWVSGVDEFFVRGPDTAIHLLLSTLFSTAVCCLYKLGKAMTEEEENFDPRTTMPRLPSKK